ncbi:MAG: right-handed parallel beta-helix repeat-containing protein [Sphingobacteriales bacterium]|nr:right-handed parallel beta-helix repeat-containing protein [Sphingobacteriales bacterium]
MPTVPFIENGNVVNYGGDPTGSGIVVGGVQGCLIEGCTTSGNGVLCTSVSGGAGVWAYGSDKVTIQFCTSTNNTSQTIDGGGFDFDNYVSNSVMQYNYSNNNLAYGYMLNQWTNSNGNITLNPSFGDGNGNYVSHSYVYSIGSGVAF